MSLACCGEMHLLLEFICLMTRSGLSPRMHVHFESGCVRALRVVDVTSHLPNMVVSSFM